MQITRQELTNNVLKIYVEGKWGETLPFFFTSDVHYDHPLCNRKVLKKHFDECKAENRGIFIFGDLNDAMQGREDRRRSIDEWRPEYRATNYFDVITTEASNFLSNYAEIVRFISKGNHELSVLDHNQIDLIQRIVGELRVKHKSPVIAGDYWGWIKIYFDIGGHKQSKDIYFSHGRGGSAPVTRGVIDTNRISVWNNADIVILGHNHQVYDVPIKTVSLTNAGNIVHKVMYHLRSPGYLEEYKKSDRGYSCLKMFSPHPIGGFNVDFFADGSEKSIEIRANKKVQ